MVLLNCHYGNGNSFTLKLTDNIEYGQLYPIFAKILNINDTNIAYIIYSGKIIGSKKAMFTDIINVHYPIAEIFIIPGNSIKMTAKYLHYSLDDDFNDHLESDMFAEKITEDIFYKNIIIEKNNISSNDTCFCGDLIYNEFHINTAQLKCGHMFHENCIKTAVVTYAKIKCPLCDSNIITIW